jgi:hypothetical protein
MKTFYSACFASALISSATVASAVPFDFIDINYTGNAAYQGLFNDAEAFWEDIISGRDNGSGSVVPDFKISIDASVVPDDGVGGVLASAGPDFATCSIGAGFNANIGTCNANGGIVYTTAGSMNFDSADIDSLAAGGANFGEGGLLDVIIHEMAHVLGFGTLWGLNNLYVDGTGQYTSANTLAAYQAECDATATFVPVELDGGPGTANGHWDEQDFACGGGEIMTGFISNPNYLSATTLAAFEDLGYTIASVTAPAVPLPAGGVLMISAFGGLVVASRRKAKKAA